MSCLSKNFHKHAGEKKGGKMTLPPFIKLYQRTTVVFVGHILSLPQHRQPLPLQQPQDPLQDLLQDPQGQ